MVRFTDRNLNSGIKTAKPARLTVTESGRVVDRQTGEVVAEDTGGRMTNPKSEKQRTEKDARSLTTEILKKDSPGGNQQGQPMFSTTEVKAPPVEDSPGGGKPSNQKTPDKSENKQQSKTKKYLIWVSLAAIAVWAMLR